VKVYSEVGKGSTFKLLFPCSDQLSVPEPLASQLLVEESLQGTVLIVDDEETIRATASMMLQNFGFNAITAQDGEAGVAEFAKHHDNICAVLLDMTMPKMNGEECFRELRRIDPDVVVILSSGYNEQDATNRFVGKGLAGFIQKPYSPDALRELFVQVLKSKQ